MKKIIIILTLINFIISSSYSQETIKPVYEENDSKSDSIKSSRERDIQQKYSKMTGIHSSPNMVYPAVSFLPTPDYTAIGLSINYERQISRNLSIRLGYGFSQGDEGGEDWAGNNYSTKTEYHGFLGMINILFPDELSTFILGFGISKKTSFIGIDDITPITASIGYRHNIDESDQAFGIALELAYGMIGLNMYWGLQF